MKALVAHRRNLKRNKPKDTNADRQIERQKTLEKEKPKRETLETQAVRDD
jgi:hypothetical protein